MKNYIILFITLVCAAPKMKAQTYSMPPEHEQHEGTWLQWPHQYEYGSIYRNRLDATWVAMTQALVGGEKVHIIAYNNTEKTRIIALLTAAGVSQVNVDFKVYPTNDVWVRDNGPIFVRDATGNLKIQDWGFNGWGDYNFNLCNPIPASIGTDLGLPVINLNSTMIIEGGSYELDGSGVFMATKSAIISQAPANSVRNPGMTQAQAEAILTTNLGVSKFIWLEGAFSADDVTDFHIDGFFKFIDSHSFITMSDTDLAYWGIVPSDIAVINNASNTNNIQYTKTILPLTQNDVTTAYGNNLGYKGSYLNFYIGNTVVLVPNYSDPNDAVANALIQGLYPGRTVVGIDVRNLYENGGMVHCVTQQQPTAVAVNAINEPKAMELGVAMHQNFPNPSTGLSSVKLHSDRTVHCQIEIYSMLGELVAVVIDQQIESGEYVFTIDSRTLDNGLYNYVLKVDHTIIDNKRLVVVNE
jgi:agmatine deiminase